MSETALTITRLEEGAQEAIIASDAEPQGYRGAGMTPISKEDARALATVFKDEEHDIKTTEAGEVYVGQVHVRRRLNDIIGPGQWAMVPVPDANGNVYFREQPDDGGKKGTVVCMRGRLYIRGNFISEAVGEQTLQSARMTYASACEAAKSDALTRCSKDLSVGWECWDKRWCEEWRRKFAVRVAIKDGNDAKYMWRRKDGAPLRGENRQTSGGSRPESHEPPADAISDQQRADLWALATETFGRKEADIRMRSILAEHGFDSFKTVTTAKLRAVMAAIREAAK